MRRVQQITTANPCNALILYPSKFFGSPSVSCCSSETVKTMDELFLLLAKYRFQLLSEKSCCFVTELERFFWIQFDRMVLVRNVFDSSVFFGWCFRLLEVRLRWLNSKQTVSFFQLSTTTLACFHVGKRIDRSKTSWGSKIERSFLNCADFGTCFFQRVGFWIILSRNAWAFDENSALKQIRFDSFFNSLR